MHAPGTGTTRGCCVVLCLLRRTHTGWSCMSARAHGIEGEVGDAAGTALRLNDCYKGVSWFGRWVPWSRGYLQGYLLRTFMGCRVIISRGLSLSPSPARRANQYSRSLHSTPYRTPAQARNRAPDCYLVKSDLTAHLMTTASELVCEHVENIKHVLTKVAIKPCQRSDVPVRLPVRSPQPILAATHHY